MSVKKNFVVKNGIEVADNLIFAESGKVGVNTLSPEYSLDVKGDVAFSGNLYTTPETQPSSTTGTVTAGNSFFITGVNTSFFRVNDLIDDGAGGFLASNTKVTSVGVSSIGIVPGHTRISGSGSISITIIRRLTAGEEGQSLVSRGPNQTPVWKTPSGATLIETSTTSQVRFPVFATGAGSTIVGVNTDQLSFIPSSGNLGLGTTNPTSKLTVIGNALVTGVVTSSSVNTTNLNVSGVSTLGFITASNVNVSGSVTATTFNGNLVGIASTSRTTQVTTLSSSVSKYYPTFATGTGFTSVALTTSSLFIDPSTNNIGLGTTNARYSLDVVGDIGIDSKIYAPTELTVYDTRSATVNASNKNFVGINTSEITVGDLIDDGPGGILASNTVITSVGVGSVGISPSHTLLVGSQTVSVTLTSGQYITPGRNTSVLVSGGSTGPALWRDITNLIRVGVGTTNTDENFKVVFTNVYGDQSRADLKVNETGLVFNPFSSNLGIGSTSPTSTLDVVGNAKFTGVVTARSFAGIASTSIDVVGGIASVSQLRVSGVSTFGTGINTVVIDQGNITTTQRVTALEFFGNGVNLSGIVTQITAGIGVSITSTQNPGKGVVNISSYYPIGKTIFVTQNGNDTNSGLTENDSKRSIKAAAAIAFPGDTIKVFPGAYVENNPIYLRKRVAVEGTELRNCIVTPKYSDRDLFYVNNSCHITDLSFIGPAMTDGAAVVALQPLAGVATDRFFDAARLIRFNLDYIASEAVGFLTSTNYKNPAFVIPTGNPNDCKDDIKDILKAIIHDITRGGNSKCVGAGKSYYSDAGSLLHITGTDVNGYSIKQATIDTIQYAAGIARSCVNNISWTGNHQSQFTQVKDLGMQPDPATGSNSDINSCANVISAIYSCVGVVTSIINNGLTILGAGINTTFPGNRGVGISSVIGISTASYNNVSGQTTILAPGLSVKPGSIVEVRDLIFECSSGGPIGTQRYPSGAYGYNFDVTKVNNDGSFVINTGVSTIAHTYKGGGYVVNRALGVTTAVYNNVTGITTITAPGLIVRPGDFVRLHDLEFSCTSGAGTTTLYPTGNLGYEFKVLSVVGLGTTFTLNTGVSTIPHTYVKGGVVFPPYSPGVGPITQGPYVRNCTNFISNSIGMKVDGFNAEPGDQDDIGVTGTMSVDSYTQYNQGGIGVSITNGAYAQLVSIFTICDDIGIYTESGGQCDITNSNCSFGNYGLYSKGVGDRSTKSIYRYTGVARTDASAGQAIIEVSGVGNLRPYDGQAIYFGELYYEVRGITITDGGSGYTQAPVVTIDAPTGPNGIRAEASANINSSGRVTSIDVISTGNQYRLSDVPKITIAGPTGAGTTATATLNLYPLYYTIESATLPSAGISTIVLNTNLNNTVGAGTTVYFTRLSLQIATSISLEWVGAGTNINTAKPALGGVAIQENEVVKDAGGQVVYTSTNQAGNFQIGDDIRINQLTGTISGRAFNQSILNTVTPLIIALGN